MESDKFKFIISFLNCNKVFLVNFFRNVIQVIAKVGKDCPSRQRLIAEHTQSLLIMYSVLQKDKSVDPSVFIELNVLIKSLTSPVISVASRPRPKKLSSIKSFREEDKLKQEAQSQFDDLINFRLLRLAHKWKSLLRLLIR